MKQFLKLFIISAALSFAGCDNTSTHNSDEIKKIKFSSKGKPTKTLNTPNGEQEVYDPTQDPEIRKLFKEIYDHNRNSDNADVKFDYRKTHYLFSKAKTVQMNDLFRSGCKHLITPVCIEGKASGTIKEDTQQPICSKLDWGSPTLSKCEVAGLYPEPPTTEIPRVYAETTEPCSKDLKGNLVPVAHLKDIGPKSKKMPYERFEDQLDGYFKAECKAYFKEERG